MDAKVAAATKQSNLVQAAAAGTIAALLIAVLYFGRPFLVPFALAILLAFALAPLTEFLRKMRLPRTVSVVVTVLIAVGVLSGLGTFIGTQFGRLAVDLPHYQTNLTNKIESVRGAASGSSIVESASGLFNNLNAAFMRGPAGVSRRDSTTLSSAPQKMQRPIPVEIHQPAVAPFQMIESVVDPLLEPLGTFAIVIVFVVFILLQKEDLRGRFISLAGARDLQRTSVAIDDGAQRLSRYLLLQTAVNACVGLVVTAGLWLIGVPYPALWGLITCVFRFIPYVGIPAAAVMPLALALAVDPGWTMVISAGALYFTTEAITGQAIEPWLYGRQLGLSPMAVVLSAAFWTWAWGPVGLLLSTPMTMCVVVLGRHVEQLRFLDVLLGNRPALSAEENLYLHTLTGNPDDAAEHAEKFLKEKSLANYFDEVVIKGLVLAQLDINRGGLAMEARDKILLTVEELIDNLADHRDHETPPENVLEPNHILLDPPLGREGLPVLCVAGRGPLDQAAARLLTDLLERRGIATRVIAPEDASQANVHRIDAAEIQAICLSYLDPSNPTNARYLVRRLRKQVPHAPLIAGFWGLSKIETHSLEWIKEIGCDLVASDLGTAVEQITSLIRDRASDEALVVSADVSESMRKPAVTSRPRASA